MGIQAVRVSYLGWSWGRGRSLPTRHAPQRRAAPAAWERAAPTPSCPRRRRPRTPSSGGVLARHGQRPGSGQGSGRGTGGAGTEERRPGGSQAAGGCRSPWRPPLANVWKEASGGTSGHCRKANGWGRGEAERVQGRTNCYGLFCGLIMWFANWAHLKCSPIWMTFCYFSLPKFGQFSVFLQQVVDLAFYLF